MCYDVSDKLNKRLPRTGQALFLWRGEYDDDTKPEREERIQRQRQHDGVSVYLRHEQRPPGVYPRVYYR